jgi:hypothetical protein
VRYCAELAPGTDGPAIAASHRTLRLLAQRIQHLTVEVREVEKLIAAEVKATAPGLLDLFGVGHAPGLDHVESSARNTYVASARRATVTVRVEPGRA